MSEKKQLKNGQVWAHEQRDRWDDITNEKLTRLEDIVFAHLNWFDQHGTVDELISWKRPVTAATPATPATENRPVAPTIATKQTDNKFETDTSTETNTIITTASLQRGSNASRNSSIDSPTNQSALSQTVPSQTAPFKSTTDVKKSTVQTEYQQQKTDAEEEEFDEQDDEIEIVVSKRFAQQQQKQTTTLESAGNKRSASSVFATAKAANAHFLESHSVVVKDISNSIEKEDCANDKRNVEDNIETSEISPEVPYKRYKSSNSSSSTSIRKVKTQQPEQSASSSSKPSSQPSSAIPTWAQNPELRAHLDHQSSTMDPDDIFGRIPPFQEHEIFAHNQIIEIPKKAPEAF